MAELKWNDAQWEKVNSAVTEAFGKASVASAFLTCYGPLPGSAEYVRDEQITAEDDGARVFVTDNRTQRLFNLTVKVDLSSEQVADEALSSALLAFRRAAITLAQVEDDIVFNGFERGAAETARITVAAASTLSTKAQKATSQAADTRVDKAKRNESIVVGNPDPLVGLAEVDLLSSPYQTAVVALAAGGTDLGETLVTAVVNAIAELEDHSHPGPFACVLGSDVFREAHRPVAKSMVLPADRITPLLNGPLLRSGQMDKSTGIVVSLAASDIDIVVATPPKAQFLQLTPDARYLFRVYEKFRLRIKDQTAVQPLALG